MVARPELDLSIPKLRCASFHESLDAAAIGSAGAYDAFLCVEVPLPWQRDISMDPPFAELMAEGAAAIEAADGRRFRPQGLVPRAGAEGWTRVLLFERPGGADAGAYARREWWLQPDEVVPLCRSLLDAEPNDVAAFDERRVEVAADVVDVLVCTHGKRDTCCGSAGVALHDQLAERLAAVDPDERRIRLWRVSHTGGHRFAPTMLTFPDGYAWAHMDAGAVLGIALRGVAPSSVADRCRGAASVVGSAAQVADLAALADVGWEWAHADRHVTVTGFDRPSMATRLRVEGRLPDGTGRAFDVTVRIERHVPQITCGAIEAPEYDVEPVWGIESVTAVPAG